MSKKTNIDFLRDILNKGLKSYDESQYDEAIEFLAAVQEDMDDAKREVDDSADEVKILENKVDGLESEITELEEQELNNTIYAGIGTIQWQSDNLQLQAIMENLDEK